MQALTKASGIEYIDHSQWPCTLIDAKYELCEGELGHGTYGSVYRARNLFDDHYYALKKMENIEDKSEMGFPITTLREIKLLQGLNHPNILNIREVVYERPKTYHRPPIIYLCLDLMSCDLADLIKNKDYRFPPSKIQWVLKNMLKGLNYLHSLNIAHRDIKPSNVLINEQGDVRIADFGLAKKLQKFSTTRVVTLWYRAPELLLGIKQYTPKVDVWAVGCLAAELLLRKPLFEQQQSESQLMKRIFQLMGTPDRNGWQEEVSSEGKNYEELRPDFSCDSSISYHLRQLSPEFENELQLLDLIEKMLRLNHHSRLTASECLEHEFFDLDYPSEPLLTKGVLESRKVEEGEDLLRKKVKQ